MDKTEETEEILVLAELTGIIDIDFLLQEHHSAKILGIDTDNPILQIDNYIFSGEYQTIKGTAVLFEEKKTDGDEVELNYLCNTFKKLAMKRVFLQERNLKPGTSCERLSDTAMDDENSANLHMPGDEIAKHASTRPSTAVEEDGNRNVCDTNNDQSIANKNMPDVVCMKELPTFLQSSVEEGKNTNVADDCREEGIANPHAPEGENADPSCSSGPLREKMEKGDHCPYTKSTKSISTTKNKNIKERKCDANFTVSVGKSLDCRSLQCKSDCSVIGASDVEVNTHDVEMTEYGEDLNKLSLEGSVGSANQMCHEVNIEHTSTASYNKPAVGIEFPSQNIHSEVSDDKITDK